MNLPYTLEQLKRKLHIISRIDNPENPAQFDFMRNYENDTVIFIIFDMDRIIIRESISMSDIYKGMLEQKVHLLYMQSQLPKYSSKLARVLK